MRALAYTLFLVCSFVVTPTALAAPALHPYTSEYYWILPHPEPAWFESDGAGGFVGATVDGTPFTHQVIENSSNIRLHKFSIGDVSYYISDQGVIKADSDLGAVSIYLTLS